MVKRALVFPGQGAQVVGMGRELAESFAECRAVFERADEILGYALSKICFEGPEEELTRTNHCQPGIFVTSVAAYTALRLRVPDLSFAATAGLSLGEWTALHIGGVLSFEDALRALEARGRLMQMACEQSDGAMASVIGMEADALRPICEEAGVELANINSPGQIVLSGDRAGIDKAKALAEGAGARKVVLLKVAGAYHSRLMAPAARELETIWRAIPLRAPAPLPIMANATGLPHGEAAAVLRDVVRQVTSCVEWVRDVEWLRGYGITEYIELGPGKVLSGLIKRIDSSGVIHYIQDRESLDRCAAALGSIVI